MARTQFNCRLEQEVVGWIAEEAERRSVQLGKSVSQADVITLLVGSAQFTNGVGKGDGVLRGKLSKKAAHIENPKASDPMASERPEIDYGSDALPSRGSVSNVGAAVPVTRKTPASMETWRAGRKPLTKPRDRK